MLPLFLRGGGVVASSIAMGNRRSIVNRSRRALKRRLLKAAEKGPRRSRHGGRQSPSAKGRCSGSRGGGVLEALIKQRTRELTEVNERLKLSMVRCKRLDGRLRESEELFRSIFEHAAAGMNTITLEGRYLQVNSAFCDFIGYSREELQHLTVFDLTHPQDLLATRERFEGIRAGKCEAFDYEKRFVCKDGKLVWGHVTSAWMFDDRRQPLYGIGLVQDISDRKGAEAELKKALASAREGRTKIACILKSVGDGLIVTDTDHRIVLMNPSAESLLGVVFEQVINRTVDDPYVTALFPEKLIKALRCGEIGDLLEFELCDSIGRQPRALQGRLSAIRDQNEQRNGIITTLRDVSRERKIDSMKTEFITTAAHELRTPLTSIQGFSEILLARSDLENDQRRSMLSIIHEQSENLSRIVNDLLDLSRIEAGVGFVLQKTPCDLSQLIEQATSQLYWTSDRHLFDVALPSTDSVVCGDRVKLRQVVENILSNAVKYSPQGGSVQVTGQRFDSEFQVSVADQGIGMSEDQILRIFDKFYRADTSNSAIEGVGLGMNIVQEIIKAHGGRIWVESCVGKGTVVHFALPTG
ncbi:MAG: PAS domain S-box protein [Desulfuromonadaceae bacterium]|nr:PAS domain S-box protein [Desulfuromonadaceae bacterium]